MRPVVVLLCCGLLGCSSKPEAPPAADVQMQQAEKAGQSDLSLGHPHGAVQQFSVALERAKLRDDPSEIGDYGYDLAVAELEENRPELALATARETRAELARRGSAGFPGLELVEATALYRTGAHGAAGALAAPLEQSSDRDVASQACFLRGLIADEQSDLAGLEAALRCVREQASDTHAANADELSARLSLRQGSAVAAQTAAESAAERRRELRDYRGMARALALAGDAARQAGSAAAASFYLRAGESAQAQGNGTDAKRWLQTALSLTGDDQLRVEAQQALSQIDKP